ncbi:MAG: hypothetical protein Q9212_005332, partial [Teloschistes hypoglaucus]
ITLLALICTTLCLHPRFRTPTYRPIRATMYVLMGLSAIVPVLHGLKLYGLSSMNDRIGLPWLVLQGVLYILGAGVYVARVPERWYPVRFDVWGASHQIFHVMVLAAAGCHLVGLLRAYEYRKMGLVCEV